MHGLQPAIQSIREYNHMLLLYTKNELHINNRCFCASQQVVWLQVRHRCTCTNLTVCGEEARLVETLAKHGRMPPFTSQVGTAL